MEFTIKTTVLVVLAFMTLLIILMIFSSSGSQSGSMLDGLFSWIKSLGAR
jgi:hypothetical protein